MLAQRVVPTLFVVAASLALVSMPRPGAGIAEAAPANGAAKKAEEPSKTAPLTIENPGFPPAYYYKPQSTRTMKPVIVYLHGRDGNPDEGCRQWAKVATEFGWLLCPSGQEARAGGGRGWNNDWPTSTKNVMGALQALRNKFGKKVQLYGNVLMGFSEGAYIAQNIGQRETKTFNRWLIIASCDRYFGYDKSILHAARKKVKRVYLWTGETDMVANESQAAFEHLRAEGITVKLNIAKGYGHQIPVDTMSQQFRKALRWLTIVK